MGIELNTVYPLRLSIEPNLSKSMFCKSLDSLSWTESGPAVLERPPLKPLYESGTETEDKTKVLDNTESHDITKVAEDTEVKYHTSKQKSFKFIQSDENSGYEEQADV